MSEEFGPDFITVTDEDGNEFELEHLDTMEHNGQVYMAFFPAVDEPEDGEVTDVDLDDEEYGLIIMKVVEENGTWYMPFDGERYRDLLITTRIEVGTSNLWSEAQSIATLDNLFDRKVLDVGQYLSRLPRGTVPNVEGLMRELKERPMTEEVLMNE